MRISHSSPAWLGVLLVGVLGVHAAGDAAAQTPSLRLVSETPAGAADGATGYAPVPAPISGEEVRAIAVDAYIYAYPMVLMEITRRMATASSAAGAAPMNQFGHKTNFADASAAGAVWPNRDVLYSNLWYDVSAEPLVVHIPDSGGRYYFMPIMDMWTDVFASRGPRTTGGGAQTFAIVGPYWQGQLPPGMGVVRSPTGMGWLLGRIQADDAQQLAEVGRFQAGMSAMPLSQWARATYGADYAALFLPGPDQAGQAGPAAGSPPVRPGGAPRASQAADTAMPPTQQVASMDAATFFATFAEAARHNPPHANDYPMLDRLRRLGMDFGKPFDFARLDPVVQQALAQAAPVAGERIRQALHRAGYAVNGWRTVLDGIGTYGADYLRRAAIAYAGLGANTPEDALYPLAAVDAEGRPLDGDEDYVIHFAADQLPPTHVFWSITLYGEDHGFADTGHDRPALDSNDPLHYNADGSLDLYIQHDEPRGERKANWLPSPKGKPFFLSMRVYWPKAAALDGTWAPPPVRED